MLWRTDVMERPCAVARGKDTNNWSEGQLAKCLGKGLRPVAVYVTDIAAMHAGAVTGNTDP